MLQITTEFRRSVVNQLLSLRNNFDGSDRAFSKQYGINSSIFSRLKNGEIEGILKDTQFIRLGRELSINLTERKWNTARTQVFNVIEEEIEFCQTFSKARICVDECDIGKTYAAKYLSRVRKNCFYLDASESKSRQLFIRTMAKRIGVDHNGKFCDVKADLKFYLKQLPNPIIIIDEAGDLEYTAFLELKELWNATEGFCGWYLIGADGLRQKFTKGIRNKKVGYREILRRFSGNYTTISPIDSREKISFYSQLITDVLNVNMTDKTRLPELVKRCLIYNDEGNFAGLTRAESLLILYGIN
jgi:hypothetical protein